MPAMELLASSVIICARPSVWRSRSALVLKLCAMRPNSPSASSAMRYSRSPLDIALSATFSAAIAMSCASSFAAAPRLGLDTTLFQFGEVDGNGIVHVQQRRFDHHGHVRADLFRAALAEARRPARLDHMADHAFQQQRIAGNIPAWLQPDARMGMADGRDTFHVEASKAPAAPCPNVPSADPWQFDMPRITEKTLPSADAGSSTRRSGPVRAKRIDNIAFHRAKSCQGGLVHSEKRQPIAKFAVEFLSLILSTKPSNSDNNSANAINIL